MFAVLTGVLFIVQLSFASALAYFQLPNILKSFWKKWSSVRIHHENVSSIEISFVNGIYHSPLDLERINLQLNEIFQQNVHSFYNPTSGWWINDLTNAGYALYRQPRAFKLAYALSEHLRAVLLKAGPHGRVLHIAHSGGAILTYMAAKYHLRKEECDRIDVITCGGGKSITRKYFPGRLVNYYGVEDPILMLDRRALSLSKEKNVYPLVELKHLKKLLPCINETFPMQVPQHEPQYSFLDTAINTIGGSVGSDRNEGTGLGDYIVSDLKHNTSFVYLNSRIPVLTDGNMSLPDPFAANSTKLLIASQYVNIVMEHSFEGPTYRWALYLESIYHKHRVNRLLNTTTPNAVITPWHTSLLTYSKRALLNIRKYASGQTKMHNFFSKSGYKQLLRGFVLSQWQRSPMAAAAGNSSSTCSSGPGSAIIEDHTSLAIHNIPLPVNGAGVTSECVNDDGVVDRNSWLRSVCGRVRLRDSQRQRHRVHACLEEQGLIVDHMNVYTPVSETNGSGQLHLIAMNATDVSVSQNNELMREQEGTSFVEPSSLSSSSRLAINRAVELLRRPSSASVYQEEQQHDGEGRAVTCCKGEGCKGKEGSSTSDGESTSTSSNVTTHSGTTTTTAKSFGSPRVHRVHGKSLDADRYSSNGNDISTASSVSGDGQLRPESGDRYNPSQPTPVTSVRPISSWWSRLSIRRRQ